MRTQIHFEDVEAFLAVASLLSFRRAAEALNTSQPTVSRRVASLERTTGVRLFRRGGVRVSLTDEGQAFLSTARHLWDAHRRAENVARQMRAQAVRRTLR